MSKKKPKYLPISSAPLDGIIIMGKIVDDNGQAETCRIKFVRTHHKYMKNFWIRGDLSYCEPTSWKPIHDIAPNPTASSARSDQPENPPPF